MTDPAVPFGPPLAEASVVAAGTSTSTVAGPASTTSSGGPTVAGPASTTASDRPLASTDAGALAGAAAPSGPVSAAPDVSLVERTREVVRDLGAPARSFTIPSTLLAVLAAYLLSLRWLDRGGLPMARLDDGPGDDVQLVL